MQDIDTYLEELRFSLSLRNLNADTIRDILREVSSECNNYEEATDNFGTPNDYAGSFPKKGAAKGHQMFMMIGVALGILWPAFQLIDRAQDPDGLNGLGTIAKTWLPALGFIALGILIDFSRALSRSRKTR
ncbi:hypothetical protein CQ010_08280 [Arthrobacter sp. MYb211]|uniref:hypothetical protein n=1 Tax=Micrococcaceae TaxID=1268 RepID=UPI000CFDE2CE|nr:MULTISPECIES: hypothetical protein [unclassified Arthrobacter]PQZ97637.1 hypothetical protein CQ017_12790 [Arthrobacter sp. MYb224]PRA04132.1 hypothetical protein CQ019_07245 [Arthrobacter sp. MYb229]PRA11650.1 hypothetical protein CQ015_09725 [Arthrobacter sp. MYb221]PRB51956.1 hypothetical protein CQ013_09335 [Arthrobacter sp. MYb216]PRC07847.1 hypothetical protein CQ010_08280 [Arthrobacter sp. MYb211]